MSNNIKCKQNNIIRFFKEAFCVDGEVKLIFENYKNFEIKAIIELNDTKKETFYIGLLKRNK